MNKDTPGFSYDVFAATPADKLPAYVEGFLKEEVSFLSDVSFDALRQELRMMDDRHLLYAIELCMLHRPLDFAEYATRYLSHPDAAVCSTAARTLSRLPPEAVSSTMVERIKATPIRPLTSVHPRTGDLFEVGTNEELLRALLRKLR